MSENLPVVHRTLELPVAEFEGEMVRLMIMKVPKLDLQADYGYPRGSHLKMELELKVRGVNVDEVNAGPNKGELVRIHTLSLVEAKIIGVYSQEEADAQDPGVGGSLAVDAEETDDNPEEGDEEDGQQLDDRGDVEVAARGLDPGF